MSDRSQRHPSGAALLLPLAAEAERDETRTNLTPARKLQHNLNTASSIHRKRSIEKGTAVDHLSPIAIGVLALGVGACAVVDVRTFRVPNVLTIPLLIGGLIYQTATAGPSGLLGGLLGALLGFAVLFGLYLLGAMGAGDVKLMAGVGAWLGVLGAIYVFAVAGVATGIYSIVILSWHGRLGQAFSTIQISLFQMKTIVKHLGANDRVEDMVTHGDRRQRLVPFGAMVALGVVTVLFWTRF